jgi:hypothetical protein
VRRTASDAAGNGIGTTIKYLQKHQDKKNIRLIKCPCPILLAAACLLFRRVFVENKWGTQNYRGFVLFSDV